MATDHFVARLSADTTAPASLSAGNHLEFDLGAGVGNLATVSTGTGQDNGILTINSNGVYLVRFSLRCTTSVGIAITTLVDHPANTQLNDEASVILQNYADDNPTTASTQCATVQSIFQFAALDQIKLNILAEIRLTTVYADGTVFELMRLA